MPFFVVLVCVAAIRHRRSLCRVVCVAFAGSCCCHSSLLVPARCGCLVLCSVLCICRYCVLCWSLRFCNRISDRIVSGQPNTYRAKKKKLLFRLSCNSAMAMAAAIRNPQRNRYSVAFFQIFVTLFRHGRHLITLVVIK